MIKILFSGDVSWKVGREALAFSLPILKQKYGNFDFIIINCENAAHGKGMTERIFNYFVELGVDAMTSGNHIWDRPEIFPILDSDMRIFRPANYSKLCQGRGFGIIERKGKKLGILNIQGQAFMPPIDNPFECADKAIDELKSQGGENLPIFVDFHAEATSEKQAMGYYLDGKVSALIGTHTHVQTADARILHHGTAFMCDAGMTGAHDGSLGVNFESVMPKFLYGLPAKFESAENDVAFNGAVIEIDEVSGLALNIIGVQVPCE